MDILRWTDPLAEGNCYVCAEGDRAVVIDPCHPQGPASLLEERGLVPEWILLTHEHCDHMLGLEALRRKYPDAPVLCSGACDDGLRNKHLNMSAMMEVYLTFKGKPGAHYPPFVCAPADQTFEDEYTMTWQGHTLRLTPLPGHTPGSICIHWDGDILFSGDYLIPGEAVITRLPGGDTEAYERLAKPWLAALEPGLWIYPGHKDPYILTQEVKDFYGL